MTWEVKVLQLQSPDGDSIEIKSNNLYAGSQRMLNVLEVGTKVPIHRHLKTSESVICLEGCLDWVFFEEMAGVDTGGPVHDGEVAVDETQLEDGAGALRARLPLNDLT
jgi:cupin fold WbuC family metalloprotein